MVTISVALAGGLIILGVIAMFVSGIRSLTQGKSEAKRIALMALPFAIFGVCYLILSDFPKAGVMTSAIMMGAMVVSITLTGLRGTFKF